MAEEVGHRIPYDVEDIDEAVRFAKEHDTEPLYESQKPITSGAVWAVQKALSDALDAEQAAREAADDDFDSRLMMVTRDYELFIDRNDQTLVGEVWHWEGRRLTLSGIHSSNQRYYLYNDHTALPFGIVPGKQMHIESDWPIPELGDGLSHPYISFLFYSSESETPEEPILTKAIPLWVRGTMAPENAYFTVPDGADGLEVYMYDLRGISPPVASAGSGNLYIFGQVNVDFDYVMHELNEEAETRRTADIDFENKLDKALDSEVFIVRENDQKGGILWAWNDDVLSVTGAHTSNENYVLYSDKRHLPAGFMTNENVLVDVSWPTTSGITDPHVCVDFYSRTSEEPIQTNDIAFTTNNVVVLVVPVNAVGAEIYLYDDSEIGTEAYGHGRLGFFGKVQAGTLVRLLANEQQARIAEDDEIGRELVSLHNSDTQINNDLQESKLEFGADIDNLESATEEIQETLLTKVDGAKVENGYLYLLADGVEVVGPLGPFSGGGGGGGEHNNAELHIYNTTGWNSKTFSADAQCVIKASWTSIEDEVPTGDGTMRVYVREALKKTLQVHQGEVTIDVTEYLSSGDNRIRVQVEDIYGNSSSIRLTATVVELSISSTFTTATPFTGAISYSYTPFGDIQKTVYFIVDGYLIGTYVTKISNRELTYTIPQQSHGAHSLRVYFESEVNGELVRSNELYYDMICTEAGNTTTIIASPYRTETVQQYTTIVIPYTVYNFTTLNPEAQPVLIKVNGETVADITVNRTEQSFSYRANEATEVGSPLVIQIISGGTTKQFQIAVTEVQIDVHAETDNLSLYLTSQGRSNGEANPAVWEYENISAVMTGFNFTTDGWQQDEDGITVLRVSGAARVTIPYKPFENDFRSTGKTIEIEFATRDVLNYDAVILSCMNANRGLELTSQRALMRSEQTGIATQYKENEHVRLSFVVEKRNEHRLVMIYINGIPSGVMQYPDNDDFSQLSPVNISIGSNYCTMDIYCIRVYDANLSRYQVLNNWIADTQIGSELMDRYTHNDVYDAYGNIVIAKLPTDLPYFILEAEELPQYKNDKKTISGSYVDPTSPSKSFTFTGCQINVQGTSSATYARKNYDMQFKRGFETNSGHIDNYALKPNVIPFNRFVLKADVASSEGANNVELVRLYNDYTPFVPVEADPEEGGDTRVRQGIDGFPIVVFWSDTNSGSMKFMGKYNFNLPKRAPGPYGFSGNMESWEFQNNTSELMLFQTDYFDETMYYDPFTGDNKEKWRYDYEARFPSDEWTNYDQLQELQTFVYSTWREEATDENLPASVTYDGVTYTKDTAAYRLAKFKAEFPTYAELDSFLFYYLFTELFLMVDSRAKNLFIGFNGSPVTETGRVATRKAVAQPYDMDTAIGTNNEGALVYDYSKEDIDHIGEANVFNGQDSVLWNNIRDAYFTQIAQMYQRLRTAGFNYALVENRFEEHQSKWPEAVWIEDAWFKYIVPLWEPLTTDPETGQLVTTNMYLPMMQGSKEEQRKWWLVNRFRYMDSKFNAGDALLQVIQLRAYAQANMTITPYADIYPTVKWGSYLVQERGQRNVPTTLVCPMSYLNDTEVYVYSAPQISSIGDLSQMKIGLVDVSMATRLQELKIGDADPTYDNPNMYGLSLGTNTLLRTLDVRNCSGLGTAHTEEHEVQKTVDISGCTNIEYVYFEGTTIQGVVLPVGGILKELHLPDTITNLTIQNQPLLEDLDVEDYSNITTLRIENCQTVDDKSILAEIVTGARVRLIGFSWEVEDYAELTDLVTVLRGMRGMDATGSNLPDASQSVVGTIYCPGSLTGEQIEAVNEYFPYIQVTADSVTATVTFMNGSTVARTQTVTITDMDTGADTTYGGTTPTKSQDAQYSYTFAGWTTNPNGTTVEANALTGIKRNRTVYAVYTVTARTYTVRFYNGSTLLESDTGIAYGGSTTYDGSTPVDPNGYEFIGWEPLPTNIQPSGSSSYFDCYAQFQIPAPEDTITDSWDDILTHISLGDYATRYNLGDTKNIDLGEYGIVSMQIVAFDTDMLANEQGSAAITWISKQLLDTNARRMNPEREVDPNDTSKYIEGTGTIGGWEKTEMRTWLKETVKPLIPANVLAAIKPVKKYSTSYNTSGSVVNNSLSTEDIWFPSSREIKITGTNVETTGPQYTVSIRGKRKPNSDSNLTWWLRTAYGSSFLCIDNKSVRSSQLAYKSAAFAIGFCT